MTEIEQFIQELQAYQSAENVFNPWRDYDENYDISPKTPIIRSRQLQNFLSLRIPGAKYLLVAEAVGYQGGRFSGVAMTSERIMLGNHETVDYSVILSKNKGRRTSNPNNINLKNTQKQQGFTEPTATIVWGEIINSRVSPYDVITWNIFPFHPFDKNKGPLSNRTPNAAELEVGASYTKMLLGLCANVTVIAIGKHSNNILNKMGIENIKTPHPSMGGVNKFKSAIRAALI